MRTDDWHARNLVGPNGPKHPGSELAEFQELTPRGRGRFKPSVKDGNWWAGVIIFGLGLMLAKWLLNG